MSYVFISHASDDDIFADRICAAFQDNGIDAWADHANLKSGDDWNESIQHALQECSCGLFVLSPRSYNRLECINEWRTILDLEKKLYVALAEPLTADKFPYRLRTIQYTDLSEDFDGGMKDLIFALKGQNELPKNSPTTKQAQQKSDLSESNTKTVSKKLETSIIEVVPITVVIETEFDKFTSKKALELTAFIAMLGGVGVHEVRIVDAKVGSVVLKLELPQEAAERIIAIAQSQPELLAEFGIKAVFSQSPEKRPPSQQLPQSPPPRNRPVLAGKSRVLQYHVSRLLYDKNRDARLKALAELALLGDPDILELLQDVFENDPDPEVKKAAQDVGRAIFLRRRDNEEMT